MKDEIRRDPATNNALSYRCESDEVVHSALDVQVPFAKGKFIFTVTIESLDETLSVNLTHSNAWRLASVLLEGLAASAGNSRDDVLVAFLRLPRESGQR